MIDPQLLGDLPLRHALGTQPLGLGAGQGVGGDPPRS